MTDMKPITILLAAYKGNAFAGAMIDSILAQDCDTWKLVLSDDGEDTAELLESYARRFPDRITHLRSGLRFGSAQKHFLYLLEQYKDSPYIMFCDQDDIWHPDKVRKTFELMQKTEAEEAAAGRSGSPVLVHTDLRVVDGELKELAPSFTAYSSLDGNRLAFHELLMQNVVTGCTTMINQPLADMAVRAKDCPQMLMHDWWLALIAAAFGKAAYLPEATIDYRQHGKNTVGAKNPRSLRYIVSRIKGQNIRKSLDDTARQAEAFAALYGSELSAHQQELLAAYASLLSAGKLKRLMIYRKYHLWKQDPRRRIAQLIWG